MYNCVFEGFIFVQNTMWIQKVRHAYRVGEVSGNEPYRLNKEKELYNYEMKSYEFCIFESQTLP